jgi:hypothetical protein
MHSRWFRKGNAAAPDPQVAAAAASNASTAQQAENWNENFYNQYVAPSLTSATAASQQNTAQQQQIFNLTQSEAQLQNQRYQQLGIPAEDAYYKMVQDYSAPAKQEEQAQAAIGDARTAQAGQAATQARQMQSLGVDPTSPAALSATSDMAVQNAAVQAKAATDARRGAQQLGMQLTSDAANFGRGGQSGILGFSGAASGASSAGTSGANQTAAVVPGGAANVNAGLGLAQKAYGANLDAFTTLQKTAMAQPSPLAGIGQLVGTLGGAALSAAAPGAGGVASSVAGNIFSDRRLKKHTKRIATLAHDIGVWMFHYIWEPDSAPLRYGYMADEVEPVFPEAVVTGPGGYKMLDYGKVAV